MSRREIFLHGVDQEEAEHGDRSISARAARVSLRVIHNGPARCTCILTRHASCVCACAQSSCHGRNQSARLKHNLPLQCNTRRSSRSRFRPKLEPTESCWPSLQTANLSSGFSRKLMAPSWKQAPQLTHWPVRPSVSSQGTKWFPERCCCCCVRVWGQALRFASTPWWSLLGVHPWAKGTHPQ